MTGWMDDRTDGRMDDTIDGWNDVSWRPLLYVIIIILQQTWGEFQKIEKMISLGFQSANSHRVILVGFQR
jgi:hypothetical protein